MWCIMIIIDPLRQKIQALLVEGQSNPLNQARQRYGTEDDIANLLYEYETQSHLVGARRFIFIDLTPFERIGRLSELVHKLSKISDPHPILLVMSESIISILKKEFIQIPLLVALYSEKACFIGLEGVADINEELKNVIIRDLRSGINAPELIQFRREVTERNLTQLLFHPNCLDIPQRDDTEKETVYIAGRYYRKMTNKMLVSSYLNLKEIGKDYNSLTILAYEIILEIMQCFRRDFDALGEFDLIVAPNNTALFLASCLQAILEKPIIAIDRLGPIPSLQLHSTKLERILSGKRVIVIEEEGAAGNEVDRTLMFLNHMKAELIKIIAIYNLEVGMPLLLKEGQMVSLCRPKKELKYVYRSQ